MSTENATVRKPELPPSIQLLPTLRALQPSDRAALVELIEGDALFTPAEVQVALELIDDALAEPGEEYLVLVAEHAGKLAGYVCYGPTPMTEGTWDLYWIVTHRDARGRGVARALVMRMEHEIRARGARLVRVETSHLDGYGAAHAFYTRLQYPVAARVRDFYKPGDDLLILVKHL
jgi:ribosomal protein S18 acetylase RimI-like enzyme